MKNTSSSNWRKTMINWVNMDVLSRTMKVRTSSSKKRFFFLSREMMKETFLSRKSKCRSWSCSQPDFECWWKGSSNWDNFVGQTGEYVWHNSVWFKMNKEGGGQSDFSAIGARPKVNLFCQVWTDSLLAWNTSEQNVSQLVVPIPSIWQPNVQCYPR